jgi:hypothetical protein
MAPHVTATASRCRSSQAILLVKGGYANHRNSELYGAMRWNAEDMLSMAWLNYATPDSKNNLLKM